MEYHKIINLFDNTQDQPFKFRTKNRVEINDESQHRILLIVISNLKIQC